MLRIYNVVEITGKSEAWYRVPAKAVSFDKLAAVSESGYKRSLRCLNIQHV